MSNAAGALASLIAISAAIVAYYWFVVAKLGRMSRPLVYVTALRRRYPTRDVSAAINLPLAGLAQLAFCLALAAVIGISLSESFVTEFQPMLLVYGVMLGIGDMALSTFLCNVGINVADEVAPRGGPAGMSDWLTVARGGWMRYYSRTVDLVPLPLAVLSIGLYVAVEELVFRVVVLDYLEPLGAVVAVIASAALFATVQAFHMPSWRSAMFPVIGAVVVGILHGALFIAVPNVVPLIIAHIVFLIIAIY